MPRLLGLHLLLALAVVASPAWAKDKDKDKDEEEDEDEVDTTDKSGPDSDVFKDEGPEEEAVKRSAEGDTEDSEEPKDELDFNDEDEGDEIKFEDEEEEGQVTVGERQPGEDTAQIYRDQQKKVMDMTPDEEQLAWEKYLNKYPKSLFRDRIEERMEALSVAMFNERVPGSDRGSREIDAALRELNFAQPEKFASVDTRSHAAIGFELGLPNWFSLVGDFEYAFYRQASLHVGLSGKVNGPVLHAGAKYALIKSSRTGTILTPGIDLDILTVGGADAVPLMPYPKLAFGQRIDLLDGLDIQAQIGARLDLRSGFDPIYSAGLSIELRPSEVVTAFVETTGDIKYLGADDVEQPFKFFVATFGLRFRAKKPTNTQGDGRIDVGLAASAPYAYSYWADYNGAANIAGDFYLGLPSLGSKSK